jgi:L-asparagine transporter-like permease
MFSTNTLWFEIAIISIIFAFGNIFMGHFEEQTPKWRRALKVVVVNSIMCSLSYYAGREWAFGFLGIMLLAVIYVHGIWLPLKGINGFTGEPKNKYYELRKWKKKNKS